MLINYIHVYGVMNLFLFLLILFYFSLFVSVF